MTTQTQSFVAEPAAATRLAVACLRHAECRHRKGIKPGESTDSHSAFAAPAVASCTLMVWVGFVGSYSALSSHSRRSTRNSNHGRPGFPNIAVDLDGVVDAMPPPCFAVRAMGQNTSRMSSKCMCMLTCFRPPGGKKTNTARSCMNLIGPAIELRRRVQVTGGASSACLQAAAATSSRERRRTFALHRPPCTPLAGTAQALMPSAQLCQLQPPAHRCQWML